MKYIIMAGTNNPDFAEPRQLYRIGGESIIYRTIRLLREAGVEDIAISSNNEVFEQFGIPVLHHKNIIWLDGFYPIYEPVCYVFGDVFFSEQAIQTIVETQTDSVQFFASAPPFDERFMKKWAEPFAFKVVDVIHFRKCIGLAKMYRFQEKFNREPCSWELWQVIKGTPLNEIDYTNYCVINDYTCDVDELKDAWKLEQRVLQWQNT